MLETMHLNKHIDPFLAAHPSRDGWKLYRCTYEPASQISLPYLLDFLRDRASESLKTRWTVNEARTDDFLGTPEKSHITEGRIEWDQDKEFDADDWMGLVEIEWKGQPIHYYSFEDEERIGPAKNTTLVATKSNDALRDFNRSLQEYGDFREPKNRLIKVVNGEAFPIPRISWDDVVLPPGFAEEIQSNVTGFFRGADRYRELGLPYRRGFLFTGSPGCGKTLTLKAMANTIDATFITVLTKATVDEGDIHHAFYLAAKHAPAVVFFEDLDRLVDSEHLSLSYFLNLLDGFKALDGLLVVATANDPTKLDPALVHRPSRFDRVWKFPLPKLEQRRLLLQKKGRRHFSTTALDQVAQESDGFSMAYVQEIVVNALLECTHTGAQPEDTHLLQSLTTLKAQRKAASKEEESLANRESLGFAPPRRKRFGPFSDDFQDE
jgi:SpoVK/Ycf46/Vps4 family AAA+-type ATPase